MPADQSPAEFANPRETRRSCCGKEICGRFIRIALRRNGFRKPFRAQLSHTTMAERKPRKSARVSETETTVAAVDETASAAGTSEDAIRQKAYEIFLLRGAADGDDVADWLEAERRIRSADDSELA